jgi:hypothetical protein
MNKHLEVGMYLHPFLISSLEVGLRLRPRYPRAKGLHTVSGLRPGPDNSENRNITDLWRYWEPNGVLGRPAHNLFTVPTETHRGREWAGRFITLDVLCQVRTTKQETLETEVTLL